MPLVLERGDLARYTQAIRDKSRPGFDIDFNNAQLLLLLSSVTEPAMLLLLAKRNCPIRPLGAVNVRNRFELLRQDLCSADRLLNLEDAMVIGSLSSGPRKAKRGLEYDLEIELSVPEDDGRTIVFRQVFTMLQFMKRSNALGSTKNEPKSIRGKSSAAATLPVNMEIGDPSKWAAVCKDYNPIHTSAVAARIFGFSGKIAHGNHVVAKAIDELVRKSSDSQTLLNQLNVAIWMEIEFKRPVHVPVKLDFRISNGSIDGKVLATFELLQLEKTSIHGALGVL
ncbi:hypothetical protein MBLNU459_g6489t2 [Dothideomycetes sp. NU459]